MGCLGVGASDIWSDRLTAELKREQMHFLHIIEMASRRWVKFDQVIPEYWVYYFCRISMFRLLIRMVFLYFFL